MLLLFSGDVAVQNTTTEHNMKNYQFLLFDADNTLFNFDASERLTFFEFAGLYGITANEQTYSLYKKFNLETWAAIEKNLAPKDELLVLRYKKLFDALDISGDAEKANIDFLKILSTKGILYPETLPLLTRLRAAGKKIYLITNGVAEVQDGRIAATDTTKYFDGIFISETVGASKPAKEFFDAVKNGIQDFHPENAIVIGDSLTSDMQGANNAGIDCLWFNPQNKPAPDHLIINYTAKSLDEIGRILLPD